MVQAQVAIIISDFVVKCKVHSSVERTNWACPLSFIL